MTKLAAGSSNKPSLQAAMKAFESVRVLEAQREEEATQAEEARVYQLAFWPDDKRAMPTEFIRSALFAGIQAKHATLIDGEQIASVDGLSITYTGQRLTQVHADVWEGIMHLARQFPEGERVTFRARQFLRLIGRHTGKSQRDELKRLFNQLTATSVEVNDTRSKRRRFWGSLLPSGAGCDEADDTLYVVELNRNLLKLFDRGYSTVDWQLRRLLLKKPLALWLQHFLADCRKPTTVAFLHKHSGSTARSLRHFRQQLRGALDELRNVGVLTSWRLDELDTVHVIANAARVPTAISEDTLATAHAPKAGLVQVSDRARALFTEEFPSLDFAECLGRWQAWTGSKQARKPDAAFLGWVRRTQRQPA